LLANRFLNLRRRLEGSGHPAVRAIQAVLDDIEGVSRTDFPHQWCEFATFTFGLMLTHEPDLEGLKYRLGRDGVSRHWWLEISGQQVDLTISQFQGGPAIPYIQQLDDTHIRLFGMPRDFPEPDVNVSFRAMVNSLADAMIAMDKSMGDPAFAVSSGPHGQDGGRNADKTLLQ
tara:strand:+ start:1430 stop:1948 length:519 start_codon:yes stop_codon:yes gene_type:complete